MASKPHSSLQALHRIVAQYAAAMQELGWTWVDVNPDKHLADLEEQLETLRGPLEQIAGLHPSDTDQAPHIARRTLERAGFNPASRPS